MKYSMWPFWLKVALGIFDVLLSAVAWFWWTRPEQGRRWLLWAIALYLLLVWVFMHT
jgi:hypothetical protein